MRSASSSLQPEAITFNFWSSKAASAGRSGGSGSERNAAKGNSSDFFCPPKKRVKSSAQQGAFAVPDPLPVPVKEPPRELHQLDVLLDQAGIRGTQGNKRSVVTLVMDHIEGLENYHQRLER